MVQSARVSRFLLLAAVCAVASAQFLKWSDQQKEEFLRNGEVVARKHLSEGVTHSLKLTLRYKGITHDAHFQSIDVRKPVERTTSGLQVNFADCYKFNIAAYRLDRMLGLDMAPPSIERRIDRKKGAVTWWVDNVLMMEKDRYLKKIAPPDTEKWNRQMLRVRVFNELVYNTDANLGNLLITTDWKIRIIDFTRAFRPFKQLRQPKNLTRIDTKLYEALQALDPDEVQERLKDVLTAGELKGLLARRDRIVKFFDELARKKGRDKVFY